MEGRRGKFRRELRSILSKVCRGKYHLEGPDILVRRGPDLEEDDPPPPWVESLHSRRSTLRHSHAEKMVKCAVPGARKLRQATKDLLLAATSGEKTLESQREAFQKEQEDAN